MWVSITAASEWVFAERTAVGSGSCKTELNGYPVAAGHRLQSLLRMPVVFSPKLNHASWQTERKNTLRAIIDPCKVKARRRD